MADHQHALTNYVCFRDLRTATARVGHYDLAAKTIQPLSFLSGTPLTSLYQVIEIGEAEIMASGDPLPAEAAKILPPFPDRDVLCVGKNYMEHAREFNSSGFDSSDKVDRPSHPVIFTKRFTSIIGDGEEIYPHPEFTQTADFEGEIGVVVGKAGYRISEEEAMDHVWGYTIVDDMTARERQRDHKQFYIGKSPDTFCPMGPIAVPAHKLDKVLRIQTHVNGELRQNATTDDLIFSIPVLIKTLSEGQTLLPGDVLATGTPAGVGIGRSPPVYLQPNDEVSISVSGLGTLTNRIGSLTSEHPIPKAATQTVLAIHAPKTPNLAELTQINNKPLHYLTQGTPTGPPLVFIHGLGGTHLSLSPLIDALALHSTHALHLLDLEGHGLSPTSPLSKISIPSLASDLAALFDHAAISPGATIVAQDMGCLVAAHFATSHPDRVDKLVLLSPPPSPLPADAAEMMLARADAVRTRGMSAVVDDVVSAAAADHPLARAASKLSLLGQDPEGYAKGCAALADTRHGAIAFEEVRARTVIVTGEQAVVSTPEVCKEIADRLPNFAGLKVIPGARDLLLFEGIEAAAEAVGEFLK